MKYKNKKITKHTYFFFFSFHLLHITQCENVVKICNAYFFKLIKFLKLINEIK